MLTQKPQVYDVDRVAGHLKYMAAFARSMPPAWDGAEIAHPVCGPDGQYVGRMMPGRGLYLAVDPKYVGITRGQRIPHVFAKSPVQRLADFFGRNERLAVAALAALSGFPFAAIATYDGIIAGRAGGKANDIVTTKASVTTTANQYVSLARAAGLPGAMTYLATTPPTDAARDRSTAGALSIGLWNPTNPDKKYLLTFGFTAVQQINMAILVDILTDGGAFRLTVNTEEAITTPTAITRQYGPTLGAGALVTFIATTANSTTSHQFTIKYTNQAGTSGQTFQTSAITVATAIEGLYPVNYGPFVPFAAGDYGIQSLKSTQSTVALAAGVLASNVYQPLAFVPGVASQSYMERDSTIQVDGLSELIAASFVVGCLMVYMLPNTTSTGVSTHLFRTVAG